VKRISSRVVRSSLIAGLGTSAAAAALSYVQPAAAQSTKVYTPCASEWNQCAFSGTKVVRYGTEGRYLYKAFSNGVACRNESFGGDPAIGATKSCAVEGDAAPVSSAPVVSDGKTYAQCAAEWNFCSFSGTRVVRYGDQGRFVYKTFSNGVSCRNESFGSDPAVGATKSCALESGSTPAPSVPAPSAPPPAQVVTPTLPSAPVLTPAPSTGGSGKRPSYNLGVGFFVLNGKLYDANGNEFRIRGVNKVHWDNTSVGLSNANANTTRWTVDFTRRPADNIALLQGVTGSAGTIAKQHVVMPGNWIGTCREDVAVFNQMVDTWIAQAASWKQLEKHMILNIANEWGPGRGTVWRDQYVSAIKRLRAAGYHATIAVTAGGCGQAPESIVKYGKDVFDADPEKNVIFDQHIYGVYADSAGGAPGAYDDQPELDAHVKALAATGLVVMLGEFGPGRNIGPSPTMIKPERAIQLAENSGLHWLAWAWDDNNLNGGMSNDSGFSMSYSGGYKGSADLTLFGRVVVEHTTWGLKKLARPASIFR
jgi:hypothetical protein